MAYQDLFFNFQTILNNTFKTLINLDNFGKPSSMLACWITLPYWHFHIFATARCNKRQNTKCLKHFRDLKK